MKTTLLPTLLLLAIILVLPLAACADQQPEMIAEKMAVKFTRGVTNTFTCIAELPKQSILTAREMGAPGYVVGPVKGDTNDALPRRYRHGRDGIFPCTAARLL